MGMRLKGKRLHLIQPSNLLSAGVLPGDVQVPDDGLPIVLANDAQTIGGYPRIASVIQADLWQLAHLTPNTSVYFQPVSHAIAVKAKDQQMRYFERLSELLQKYRQTH
jgi:allophanate hydrolase subunit 2